MLTQPQLLSYHPIDSLIAFPKVWFDLDKREKVPTLVLSASSSPQQREHHSSAYSVPCNVTTSNGKTACTQFAPRLPGHASCIHFRARRAGGWRSVSCSPLDCTVTSPTLDTNAIVAGISQDTWYCQPLINRNVPCREPRVACAGPHTSCC